MNESKVIECHNDLIEILDKLKLKVSNVTYGAINKVTYKEATYLLSLKIKQKGGIV